MNSLTTQFFVLILVLMDNQNTLRYLQNGNRLDVLILVLMDNQNTGEANVYNITENGVLILVLMDNQNTKNSYYV